MVHDVQVMVEMWSDPVAMVMGPMYMLEKINMTEIMVALQNGMAGMTSMYTMPSASPNMAAVGEMDG